MPAPRHPMEGVVRDLIARNPDWVPDRIYEELAQAAERAQVPLSQLPASRTIARIKGRFPLGERSAYGFVRWPETFEAGLLPWESAPTLLKEAAFALGGMRHEITVRYARWFWDIRRAAPTARDEYVRGLAQTLEAKEATGRLAPTDTQAVAGVLMFRAWEEEGDGVTHGAAAHRRAVSKGLVPDWNALVSVETDEEAISVMRALVGISERSARAVLGLRAQLEQERASDAE